MNNFKEIEMKSPSGKLISVCPTGFEDWYQKLSKEASRKHGGSDFYVCQYDIENDNGRIYPSNPGINKIGGFHCVHIFTDPITGKRVETIKPLPKKTNVYLHINKILSGVQKPLLLSIPRPVWEPSGDFPYYPVTFPTLVREHHFK